MGSIENRIQECESAKIQCDVKETEQKAKI
jgi:hypothetical protein